MITEGSTINGKVDFSIIFSGATVEEGATVNYSIVMPGTVVKKGAVVEYAIVGQDCVIHENARIGVSPETVENRDEWGIAVVGHNVDISEGAKVLPKQIISEDM